MEKCWYDFVRDKYFKSPGRRYSVVKSQKVCVLVCVIVDNSSEVEKWASRRRDCRVRVGQYGSNDCVGQYGSRRCRCTLQPAECRRPDYVDQRSQSCRSSAFNLPELHQGNLFLCFLKHLRTVFAMIESLFGTGGFNMLQIFSSYHRFRCLITHTPQLDDLSLFEATVIRLHHSWFLTRNDVPSVFESSGIALERWKLKIA